MCKLIVGLGNPGTSYDNTRHNIGFLVIDELAKRHGLKFTHKKSMQAMLAEGSINDTRILLVKPQTFMNASGQAVFAITKKYPVRINEALIVYDDADLAFGDLREKNGGTSAGHRGMESVLNSFPANTNVPRLRVGIGRSRNLDVALEDFVLQSWTAEEQKLLPEIISRAVEMIEAAYV